MSHVKFEEFNLALDFSKEYPDHTASLWFGAWMFEPKRKMKYAKSGGL